MLRYIFFALLIGISFCKSVDDLGPTKSVEVNAVGMDLSYIKTLSSNFGNVTQSRRRRTPAVWGEPAPDYSAAQLQGGSTFLYALLFVDGKISEHYQRNHELVKIEIMKLAQEANTYFYQIDLRLVIVDIMETNRNDLSLYTFESYRNKRINELPYHNFAVLVSYRYAGGLAFVSGMCTAKSVMLVGFYPHNPEAMGSIFFHEVAHLIGVPHSSRNETLSVPNCACTEQNRNLNNLSDEQLQNSMPSNTTIDHNVTRPFKVPRVSDGCLRIPGFDHDCTLQLMANLVYRNRCLVKTPLLPYVDENSNTVKNDNIIYFSNGEEIHNFVAPILTIDSIPLCGNGLPETDEDCDCGLIQFCNSWNCNAATCKRHVPLWIIYLSSILIVISIVAPLIAYCYLQQRYNSDHCKKLCSRNIPYYNSWEGLILRCCRNKNSQRKLLRRKFSASIWLNKKSTEALDQNGNYKENLARCSVTVDVGHPISFADTSERKNPALNIFARIFYHLKRLLFKRDTLRNNENYGDYVAKKRTIDKTQIHVFPSPTKSFPSTETYYSNSTISNGEKIYSKSMRPRCRPPPPPSAPTIAIRLNSPSSPTIPILQSTIESTLRRPRVPPPPCPPKSPPPFMVQQVLDSSEKQKSKRTLLPPPPPPPPKSSLILPKPPSFAPPATPSLNELTSPLLQSLNCQNSECPNSQNKDTTLSSLDKTNTKNHLLTIDVNPSKVEVNKRSIDNFLPKLFSNSGKAPTANMDEIEDIENDEDEDRYSISHKFADFDDDNEFDSDFKELTSEL